MTFQVICQRTKAIIGLYLISAFSFFSLGVANAGLDLPQTRILVLPFYQSVNADPGMMSWRQQFMTAAQQDHNGFTLVDPFKNEPISGDILNTSVSKQDAGRMAGSLAQVHQTDLAYLVWVDIDNEIANSERCVVRVKVETAGYVPGKRQSDISSSKAFRVVRKNCDDAFRNAEEQVAKIAGLAIHSWHNGRSWAVWSKQDKQAMVVSSVNEDFQDRFVESTHKYHDWLSVENKRHIDWDAPTTFGSDYGFD